MPGSQGDDRAMRRSCAPPKKRKRGCRHEVDASAVLAGDSRRVRTKSLAAQDAAAAAEFMSPQAKGNNIHGNNAHQTMTVTGRHACYSLGPIFV